MHWWYVTVVQIVLLLTVRLHTIPTNAFMDGKIVRALVTLALLVSIISFALGVYLAKHWP